MTLASSNSKIGPPPSAVRPALAALALLSLGVLVTPQAGAQKPLSKALKTGPPKFSKTAKNVKPAAPAKKALSDLDRVKAALRASYGGSLRPSLAEVQERLREETGDGEKKIGKQRRLAKKQGGEGEESADEAREEKRGVYEAMRYYLERRVGPDGNLDPSRFLNAYTQRERMPARGGRGGQGTGASAFALTTPTSGWEFLGPRNATVYYPGAVNTSLYTGRVNRVAFDAKRFNEVYLTAPSGGVWKSTDGGQNWAALGQNSFYSLKATALAVSNRTVYVGMGDFEYPWASIYSRGIMRSTDGGATFTNIGVSALAGKAISGIAVDTDNPLNIVVSTGRSFSDNSQLYRSADGGNTLVPATIIGASPVADWSNVKYGLPGTGNNRVLFASGMTLGGNPRPIVVRSANKGVTWTPLALPPALTARPFYNSFISQADGRIEIAPSAVDPNVVYLFAAEESGAIPREYRQVWRGTIGTGGANVTWQSLGTPPDIEAVQRNSNQSNYNMYLEAVPYPVRNGRVTVMTDSVYAATLGVACYMNGTGRWSNVSKTNNRFDSEELFHTDQHAIAADPFRPNRLIAGNDGGVYGLSVTTSTTPVWTPDNLLNRSLGLTEFYYADWHPTNPQIMLGGAQDNGSPASLGNAFNWLNTNGGDGGGCAISQVDPLVQYSTVYYYYSIAQSLNNWGVDPNNPTAVTDYGYDVSPLYYPIAGAFYNQGPDFFGPVVPDPADPTSIYVPTYYLWRYDGPTDTWQGNLGGQALSTRRNVSVVAIAPSDSNRIYTGSGDGEIWMSTNKGQNWTRLAWPGDGSQFILSIDVHPTNPDDILVTVGNALATYVHAPPTDATFVYHCTNTRPASGATVFTGIQGTGNTALPSITASGIARSPQKPDTDFWVGTDIGMFYTADGGATWQDATTSLGLPNVQVNVVKANPALNCINIATYGRGMWRLSLAPTVETAAGGVLKVTSKP